MCSDSHTNSNPLLVRCSCVFGWMLDLLGTGLHVPVQCVYSSVTSCRLSTCTSGKSLIALRFSKTNADSTRNVGSSAPALTELCARAVSPRGVIRLPDFIYNYKYTILPSNRQSSKLIFLLLFLGTAIRVIYSFPLCPPWVTDGVWPV